MPKQTEKWVTYYHSFLLSTYQFLLHTGFWENREDYDRGSSQIATIHWGKQVGADMTVISTRQWGTYRRDPDLYGRTGRFPGRVQQLYFVLQDEGFM